MRVVSHFRPGLVALHLWDVEHLTGPLPNLHPLSRTGILHVHDPTGLPRLLDELADRIRRVHNKVLAADEATLAEYTRHPTARGPSRGWSRCSWATASRCARRTTARSPASPAVGSRAACS